MISAVSQGANLNFRFTAIKRLVVNLAVPERIAVGDAPHI